MSRGITDQAMNFLAGLAKRFIFNDNLQDITFGVSNNYPWIRWTDTGDNMKQLRLLDYGFIYETSSGSTWATQFVFRFEFSNLERVLFGFNSSGYPYLRWTPSNGRHHQIVVNNSGITYQTYNGSTWTTVWSNH